MKNVSECCGAEIKVEYRPDHPFVYDDRYDLQVPVQICTKCGKVVGLMLNDNLDSQEK